MRKSNKGFTLVELLMAVAVFSIVMVGIISIMSSSLKAYSNSNLDVNVQEDAQLVANQLEELLSDATAIDNDSVTGGYKVSRVKNDGTVLEDYTIYQSGDKIEMISGSGTYTLASNVTEFELQGWAPNSANYAGDADNKTTIHIVLDNSSSSYSLDRTVYFRNNVENKSFKDIKYFGSSSGGGGGSEDPNVINLDVKRYQTYDLTSMYGLIDGCALKKVQGDAYVDDSSASTFFDLTDGVVVPDTGGKKAVILKAGTSINGNFGNPLMGKVYAVVGKTKDGTEKKIVLGVKPVAISDDNLLQAHNGDKPNGTVNNEGFINPISVDGININDALKVSGNSFKAEYALYDGSTKVTYYNTINTHTSPVLGTFNFGDWENGDRQGAQVLIAVAPDAYNGGLFVVFDNYGLGHYADSGNLSLKLKVTINGTALPENTFKVDKLDTPL